MRWRELTLEDLLADDIVRQVMVRDRVAADEVRALMLRVAARSRGQA